MRRLPSPLFFSFPLLFLSFPTPLHSPSLSLSQSSLRHAPPPASHPPSLSPVAASLPVGDSTLSLIWPNSLMPTSLRAATPAALLHFLSVSVWHRLLKSMKIELRRKKWFVFGELELKVSSVFWCDEGDVARADWLSKCPLVNFE